MKSILAIAFVACLIGMSKMEDGNALSLFNDVN